MNRTIFATFGFVYIIFTSLSCKAVTDHFEAAHLPEVPCTQSNGVYCFPVDFQNKSMMVDNLEPDSYVMIGKIDVVPLYYNGTQAKGKTTSLKFNSTGRSTGVVMMEFDQDRYDKGLSSMYSLKPSGQFYKMSDPTKMYSWRCKTEGPQIQLDHQPPPNSLPNIAKMSIDLTVANASSPGTCEQSPGQNPEYLCECNVNLTFILN